MGGLLVAILMVPLSRQLGGDDAALGYQRSMLVLSIVAGIMFLICFAGTRERVKPTVSTGKSIGDDLRALARNDQLLLLCLTQVVLLVGIASRGTSTLYFANHVLGLHGQTAYVTAFVTTGMTGNVIGGLSSAYIGKRFDKVFAVPAFLLGAAGFGVASLFANPLYLPVHFAFHFGWAVCVAVTVPMVWAMVTDAIDYGVKRSHRRLTGLTFAINLLAVKMGFAIGGAMVGWLLEAYGYQGQSDVQTVGAIGGIALVFGAVSSVSAVVAAFILRLYRLDGAEVKRIAKELRVGLVVCVGAAALGSGCGPAARGTSSPSPRTPSARADFVPNDGSVLFIVGQDLASVRDYIGSECCPKPAGATTYVGLYEVLNRDASYGGLGVTPSGDEFPTEVDWGGGPSHLVRAASLTSGVLAVGLDMTNNSRPGALQRVRQGDFDPQIDHLGRTLAALPNPVLLRIGYEFDGAWNGGYQDRAAYKAAYRRIAERIQAAGASNVAFVWQGSASLVDDIIEDRREEIADWYPGDDVVDWVGLSWFLRPETFAVIGTTRQDQIELVDELVAFARQRNKPVFIAEATPQGYLLAEEAQANIAPLLDGPAGEGRTSKSGSEIWVEWFEPFFAYIETNRDAVRAVAYINAHWDEQGLWNPPYENGFWGDSRVQSNPEILARWNATLSEPYWRHGGAELFGVIGFVPAR